MESDAVREDLKPEPREIARVGSGLCRGSKGRAFLVSGSSLPPQTRGPTRRDPVEDQVPPSN